MRIDIALVVFVCAVAFTMIAAPDGRCASLEVAPTTLRLEANSGSTVLYLANRGNQPIIVQVEGLDWSQASSTDLLKPTNAIIISPPMTRINPGQKQTVRLLVRPGGAPGIERTFRILASELPDPAVTSAQAVRILLQFSVPLFTAASSVQPVNLSWSAVVRRNSLTFGVHNIGNAHVKFSRLALVTAHGRRIDILSQGFAYVLADGAHEWIIAAPGIQPGERLTVEGRIEDNDHPVHALVAVRP